MTLAEFYSMMRNRIKRGASLDTEIAMVTAGALLWLERNYSFKYMERYVSFDLDPARSNPRAVAQPSGGIKSIDFMRHLGEDGTYSSVVQANPAEITFVGSGLPTRYWVDGVQYFWFNTIPDKVYTLEMMYYEYSTLPTDPAETSWMLSYGWDLLASQTMLMLAPTLRLSADLITLEKGLRDEALKTLTISQDALAQGNREIIMGML